MREMKKIYSFIFNNLSTAFDCVILLYLVFNINPEHSDEKYLKDCNLSFKSDCNDNERFMGLIKSLGFDVESNLSSVHRQQKDCICSDSFFQS